MTPHDRMLTSAPSSDVQQGSAGVGAPTPSQSPSPQDAASHDDASALQHAKAACALIFGAAGTRPFALRYWDGITEPATNEHPPFTIVIQRPGSLRRMLLPPNELSIVEAVLSGDIEIEGDIEAAMWLGDAINGNLRSPSALFALARHLFALPRLELGSDVRVFRAEHTVEKIGERHAPERDRAAIRYHYDVGNEFYALWLDKRMVYSCAYFENDDKPDAVLDAAQEAKLDLICRKLRFKPGERRLDVGGG